MASESSQASISTFIERLLPLFASISTTRPDPEDPLPDRILMINPLTQQVVVIEGGSNIIPTDPTKHDHPPASQASIDELPYTEIKCTEDAENLGGECECVICLDEWKVGDVVNEMPCKHKFHGGCVKKWLKIHGSCPVCRYKMPGDDLEKKIAGESAGRSGYAWVTVAVGRSSSNEDEETLMEA